MYPVDHVGDDLFGFLVERAPTAKMSKREDFTTRILAWLLQTDAKFLGHFISVLSNEYGISTASASKWQVYVDGKSKDRNCLNDRYDMALLGSNGRSNECLIVFEVKIDAPFSDGQIIRYCESASRMPNSHLIVISDSFLGAPDDVTAYRVACLNNGLTHPCFRGYLSWSRIMRMVNHAINRGHGDVFECLSSYLRKLKGETMEERALDRADIGGILALMNDRNGYIEILRELIRLSTQPAQNLLLQNGFNLIWVPQELKHRRFGILGKINDTWNSLFLGVISEDNQLKPTVKVIMDRTPGRTFQSQERALLVDLETFAGQMAGQFEFHEATHWPEIQAVTSDVVDPEVDTLEQQIAQLGSFFRASIQVLLETVNSRGHNVLESLHYHTGIIQNARQILNNALLGFEGKFEIYDRKCIFVDVNTIALGIVGVDTWFLSLFGEPNIYFRFALRLDAVSISEKIQIIRTYATKLTESLRQLGLKLQRYEDEGWDGYPGWVIEDPGEVGRNGWTPELAAEVVMKIIKAIEQAGISFTVV